jgi:hypothetical protein
VINTKKIISLVIVLLLRNVTTAQSVDNTISARMNSLILTNVYSELDFNSVDTIEMRGVEIVYYQIRGDKCSRHLFFLSNVEPRQCVGRSLFEILTEAKNNYHYISFDNYSSFFLCLNNNIDTFSWCQNTSLYASILQRETLEGVLHKINNDEFFYINSLEIEAYRFVSTDTKYGKYFYHFNPKGYRTRLEKIIYKRVIKRDNLKGKYFKGKPISGSVECRTSRD